MKPNAANYFSERELEKIKKAVAEAEKLTSGEIVPVLASASDPYERAEDIAGISLGLLMILIACVTHLPELRMHIACVLGSALTGMLLGYFLARISPRFKRFFCSGLRMREAVLRSSQIVFYEHKLAKTRAGTAVIIYVSLFERTVNILSDEPVATKLGAHVWDELRDLFIADMKAGNPAEGFIRAIALCAETMKADFPIEPDDIDEISNDLIIIP